MILITIVFMPRGPKIKRFSSQSVRFGETVDNYDSIHVTSTSQVQMQMMINQFDDADNDCEEFTSCEMSVVLLCCVVQYCIIVLNNMRFNNIQG